MIQKLAISEFIFLSLTETSVEPEAQQITVADFSITQQSLKYLLGVGGGRGWIPKLHMYNTFQLEILFYYPDSYSIF